MHSSLRRSDIYVSARKELLKRHAFGGRVGMQRKMANREFQIVLVTKPFNTNCTEIAPRSDVVGIHLEQDRTGTVGHR